uniref:7TM_GPCR_Srx domain-containing protein n=1 Tax=Panagrellus redivivus TaxID=6233 RepID=A0A7E4URX0_PANRE
MAFESMMVRDEADRQIGSIVSWNLYYNTIAMASGDALQVCQLIPTLSIPIPIPVVPLLASFAPLFVVAAAKGGDSIIPERSVLAANDDNYAVTSNIARNPAIHSPRVRH